MVFVKGLLYMVRLNPPREQRLVTRPQLLSSYTHHLIYKSYENDREEEEGHEDEGQNGKH